MANLDDEITRIIKGGDQKLKATAEADPYAEMETAYKERRREVPTVSVGGKELTLDVPPEPPMSPFDIARGRRDVGAKVAEAATEKARLEAGVEASAAERMKGIAGQAREMQAPPKFTPTPEDKATMVGMFGLLGAMAAFIGGGKQYGNALTAMNAMGGMLSGYNQGRKDLFEKDKQIYDKKVAENKAHNDHIKQLINTAMEEAKYDYTKAKANLKVKLAEVDAPVIKAQVDQKTLEELRNDVEKADLNYTNNLKAQADLHKKMKDTLDAKKESDKLKPTASTNTVFETTQSTIDDLSAVIKNQNNKALKDEWEKNKFVRTILEPPSDSYLSKALSQEARKQLSPEARTLAELIMQARNAYYLQISGKAVTGSEAMRNFGAMIQPSDSFEDIMRKAKVYLGKSIDTADRLIEGYAYPETYNRRYQEKRKEASELISGKTSAPPPSAPKATKPTLEQFLEKAKPANPNQTEQQLIDYYNQTYGAQ
jgi:hypothetical protein